MLVHLDIVEVKFKVKVIGYISRSQEEKELSSCRDVDHS